MKIKKNDTIKIIAGKDRGKTGKILKVFPEKDRVLVEGLNMYKKHVKPKKQGEKGQVVEVPRPIRYSNIQLVCPKCGKATRIGYLSSSDAKTRICKKCNSTV